MLHVLRNNFFHELERTFHYIFRTKMLQVLCIELHYDIYRLLCTSLSAQKMAFRSIIGALRSVVTEWRAALFQKSEAGFTTGDGVFKNS